MSLFDTQKREAMIARINALRSDATPQWGKMNCNQAVCHMTDQFRGAFGEREWVLQNSLVKKTLVKWLVLYVMSSIPKNVPTMPEVDQEKMGSKPTGFEADRTTLISYIEKFANSPDDLKWCAHPAFGPLNKKEWDILAFKHLDHHLKQFGA